METKTNNLLINLTIIEYGANVLYPFRGDSNKSSIGQESGKSIHPYEIPVGICTFVLAFFKAFMQVVAHGLVYFKDPTTIRRVKELMLHWGSCKRAAYQAIHKQELKGNDIKVYCKKNYMLLLNQRYVADATLEASKIKHEGHIIVKTLMKNHFKTRTPNRNL